MFGENFVELGFIGLDVSLAKTAICVISEHGKVVREAETASEPEVLSRWLGKLDGHVAVVGLEALPVNQGGERHQFVAHAAV